MDGGAVRRVTAFALLFGAAVGFLAWRAGGLRTERGGATEEAGPAEAAPQPVGVAPIGPGLGVGVSEDGVLARDSVKVVDGRAVRFRAWTAEWVKATPRKSPDPEIGVQDLVRPRVVLYPEPQSASAAPVKAGDPSTTTIKADAGVLSYEKDVRTEARLDGNVEVARVDPARGDFRLKTPSLTCTMETRGDAETRRARTASPVSIDGGRAHIQGVGLDADLSVDSCVVTIAREVKGRFDAPAGSLAMTGGRTDSRAQATDVSCSGACELVSLGGGPRGPDRRWKATFHDDVRVVQGADSLECDLLEIEFRMGELKSDDGMPAQHVVATGSVRVKGSTESRTYEITCMKATHRREGVVGKEADVVVFEGSPVMNFFGPLAMASAAAGGDAKKKEKKPEGRGRMEIRCAGPATMTTRRAGNLATAPHRTNVVFENDVVVRQWDDEKSADVAGEMKAPKATLYGTRLPNGSFQPDTLTAQDDSPSGPGVDLRRLDVTAHCAGATWTRAADRDIDRYMLVGEPVVRYAGVRALHPFGKATTSPDSYVTVQAADNVTVDVYAERPPAPGEGPRPYAVLTAGPRVVVVQTEDGKEVSRATADRDMRAVIAHGKQLEQLEANGNARFRGATDDGRMHDLSGARIVLDRLVLPPGAPKDAPHPSQVVALGDGKTQALAVVEEQGGARDEVRADRLRYCEEGAVVFASGHVVATIDVKARGEKSEADLSKVADGPVRITAGEAKVELVPSGASAGGRRLRKVDAGGGVVIDGKLDRIEGRQVVYDAVNGIAEVRGEGQTARVVYSAESSRYPSLLISDLIRAYVEVSEDPAKAGRITRVSCPGGGRIIRYLDAPGSETSGEGAVPRRIQIESKGAMESTRTEATARDDVIARMFSLGKSGEWTDDPMTFYAQHVRATFDADAPGPTKDKLRTLVATGDGSHQVIVEASGFFGRADRLELDARAGTVALSTSSDTKVYVRETSSGRQTIYDSVVYHYATHEWTDAVQGREIEGDRSFEKK
jgi:lipopolysaccharide export system protein LptC